MNDIFTYVISNFGSSPYFQVAAAVVSLASAICAVTSSPAPGTAYSKFYSVIEFLALNIGKAKDKGVK